MEPRLTPGTAVTAVGGFGPEAAEAYSGIHNESSMRYMHATKNRMLQNVLLKFLQTAVACRWSQHGMHTHTGFSEYVLPIVNLLCISQPYDKNSVYIIVIIGILLDIQ